jgi:hypothetical protein
MIVGSVNGFSNCNYDQTAFTGVLGDTYLGGIGNTYDFTSLSLSLLVDVGLTVSPPMSIISTGPIVISSGGDLELTDGTGTISISSNESISLVAGGDFAYDASCYIDALDVAFTASGFQFFNGSTNATNFTLTYFGTSSFSFPSPAGVYVSYILEIITTSDNPTRVNLESLSTYDSLTLKGPSIILESGLPSSNLELTTNALSFDTSSGSLTYQEIIMNIYSNASIYGVTGGIASTKHPLLLFLI